MSPKLGNPISLVGASLYRATSFVFTLRNRQTLEYYIPRGISIPRYIRRRKYHFSCFLLDPDKYFFVYKWLVIRFFVWSLL